MGDFRAPLLDLDQRFWMQPIRWCFSGRHLWDVTNCAMEATNI
jgi:hypothetical protein